MSTNLFSLLKHPGELNYYMSPLSAAFSIVVHLSAVAPAGQWHSSWEKPYLSNLPSLPCLLLYFSSLYPMHIAQSLLRFNLILQCVSEPVDLLVWWCWRHIWDSLQKKLVWCQNDDNRSKPLNHFPSWLVIWGSSKINFVNFDQNVSLLNFQETVFTH